MKFNCLKYLLSCFLIFASCICLGQNKKIDSLLAYVKTAKEDTQKINAINSLSKQFLKISEYKKALSYAEEAQKLAEKLLVDKNSPFPNILKRDIATSFNNQGNVFYYESNYDKCLEYYNKALKLYEDIDDKRGIANCINNQGLIYYTEGNYTRALDLYSDALTIRKLINDKPGMASSYNNLALVMERQGNYPASLECHFKSLAIFEELKDNYGLANILGNIGAIYSNQNNNEKALEYYLKALKIQKEISNKHGMANLYNNLGIIYLRKGKFDEAMSNNEKGLDLRKEIGDEYGIAFSMTNAGSIYFSQKKYEAALKENLDALAIREKIKDSLGIALSLNSVGNSYFKLKNPVKAIEYCTKGLTVANSIGELSAIEEADKTLSEIFAYTKQYEKAYGYFKNYLALRDSLLNDKSTKESVRAEMNYEFTKKEAADKAEQEKRETIAAVESHKQKLILWGVTGILLLVFIFAVFAYRSYLQKQKAHTEISQQKHIIEEKQKEILDSIQYAQRIQKAMLTSDTYFSSHLKNYFTLYKPKDIVSGDFYWAIEHTNKFYIVTGDCTGHGVPGAFMSLINISILNELIIEREVARPDLILNEARTSIIKALNTGTNTESKDGMDCVLCCFDFKNNTLEYASANNSFYIIREKELIVCKADKMHVGMGERKDPFTYNKIELQENDIVYTFTDGYADQFGGDKGKKFKSKQQEELLLSICHLSMEEQKNILSQKFDGWKGKLEQVDDVLVIGVKI